MKHRVPLTKSQLALIKLAKDIQDQLIQSANNGFQQRVAVVAEELGVPSGTRSSITDGDTQDSFCMEWESQEPGPALVTDEVKSA